MATSAASDHLLVIIDSLARRTDGESVRIVKDVLSAGAASTKVCLPENPEEFARALRRRGSRRLVLVGDDRALVRATALLHRHRELTDSPLSMVPVGCALSLSHSLGLPPGPVAAARTVLDGTDRRMDLLIDESDGVVLGTLHIPPPPSPHPPSPARPWLRPYHSLIRTLAPTRSGTGEPPSPLPCPARLRVEIDGMTLVDLHQPVTTVRVTPGASGMAEIEIHPVSVGAEATPLHARAHKITVSGTDFRYHADTNVSGPVRRRTWTVWEGGWRLRLPVG